MTTMVVTGATSGIGRSIAFEFAARQAGAEACLILCYRSDALEADSMAKSLSGEFGCFVKSISADLSTREGLNDLLRYLGDERVDYLSYNVGMGIYRPFSEITLDEWDRVMFANLTAPVFLVPGVDGLVLAGRIRFYLTGLVLESHHIRHALRMAFPRRPCIMQRGRWSKSWSPCRSGSMPLPGVYRYTNERFPFVGK